jgi:glutaredoxin 3
MPKIELYGTATCPYTRDMREWLEWTGRDFEEYDVEVDADALRRMREVSGGQRTAPVLVEDGKAVQIGWQGRGCVVGRGAGE